MDILSSFILFAVFIIAYIAIVEIFTVLFRLTGLTEEKAKMQVISMLTTSGFTTAESEIVVSSKRRRRLTRITILFGYSFNVIIVSIIVNVFMALNRAEIYNLFYAGIIMVLLFITLFLLTRIKWVKRNFDQLIEKMGNRLLFGKGSNAVVLLDTYSDKVIAEIILENIPDFLEGARLDKSHLKEQYNIQVLLVKRDDKMLGHVSGDTILQKNDVLVVFGSYKSIRSVFEHPGE